MIQVELQQPVMITYGNHGKRVVTRRGTVTKIGRVWIEVTPAGALSASYRFRLDTQTDGTGRAYAARFYTLDQWAERERKAAALAYLHEQGIFIRHGGSWFGREVELADILRRAAAGHDGASQA